MGGSQIRGTILGGPYNKDYSILGSILGSPILGNYPITQLFTDSGPTMWVTIPINSVSLYGSFLS